MAAKTYSVGTSTLTVVPDFTGAQGKAKAFTDELARNMANALRGGIERGLQSGPLQGSAARTGNAVGGTLADTIRGRLQAALRSLPKVQVDASTDAATRRIQELRGELSTISARVGVNLDSEQASARIAVLEAELKALSDSATDLDVKANTQQATRALELVRAEVERIKGAGATVTINADVGSFAAQVRRALEKAQASLPPLVVSASTTPAQRELEGLRVRLEALSSKRIGVDIDAARALADLSALETELAALAASTTEVDVDVNAAAAAAALAAVRAEVERLRAERVVIPIELNVGRFVATAAAAVEAAQRAIPDLVVGINSTPAQIELAALRADLAAVSRLEIGVDIDAGAFYAEAQRISERLRELSGSTAEVDVKADAAAAAAELAAIDREVERLDGKTARVDVDSTSLNTFTGRIVLVGAALLALAPAALPGLGAIVVGIGAIGAAAGAVLPAVGALLLGFSGVGGALTALAKRDQDAAKTNAAAAQQRTTAAAQVASANRSLESSEASLANARASAASSAQRSAQAIVVAQAAVAKAEKDAADSVAQAAQRRSDAAAALQVAEADAAYSAQQSARSIADAQKALGQTVVAVSVAVAAADQRAADARQNVADVTQRSSDRVVAALRDRESAERTLATAQQRSLDLEQALTDARTGAAQSLEDMGLRLQSNTLRQQEQQLDLADAQQRLAKVLADPLSSPADIQRAQLAVQEQQQAIAELTVAQGRLRTQYDAATKAGVDGSDAVKQAQQAIIAQTQAVADAEQALADKRKAETAAQLQARKDIHDAEIDASKATLDASQSRIDASQRVRDAEQAVADAQQTSDRQALASTRSLEAARRAVGDADQTVADAQLAAAESVATAQQRVIDAQTAAAESARSSAASVTSAVRGVEGSQASLAAAYAATAAAGVSATDEVAAAFAKLGPVGAGFATFLYSLRPQLEGLQQAAAGGLLPGLQTAITALLPLLPTFEGLLSTFGTALGQLAIDAATALNGDTFAKFFAFLQTNGPAIVDTAGKIVGNLLLIFPALSEAFGPVGQVVGDALVRLTGSLVTFLENLNGSAGFNAFLDYVRTNGPAVGEFFTALLDALVALVKSAAPFGPIILGILTGILNLIASLPPGVLAGIVLAIVGLVGVFNLLAPVIAFVAGIIAEVAAGSGILAAVIAALGGPVTLIIAGIVLLAAAFVAAYESSSTFRDIVNGAIGGVRDFAVAAWENVLKPTFEALATFFTKTIPDAALFLWHNAIEPAFNGIRSAIDVAIGVVRTILDALVYVWRNVIAPAALFLWHNVFEPAFAGIRFAVEVFWNVAKLLLDLLVFYWRNVLAPAALFLWHNVFEPVFSGLAAAVRFAWEQVIRPALQALVDFWRNVITPAATYLKDNVFGPVFNGIGSAVSYVWNSVLKPALDALAGFFTNTLGPAVSTGVAAFKGAWALMQAAAADPINFVIREVYTGGIKALFDKVAETIGSDARLPPLKEITVPKVQLASGGPVPGYSPTKRADNIPAMLTAREYVQPVDSVDYYGTSVMDAMRRRAIPREAFQHLAGGGTVDGLVALGHKLQSMGVRVSENKYFGGVTPNAHAANGWHYKLGGAGAIDLNLGTGNPPGEKAALDSAVAVAQQAGFRTLWQTKDHFDHAHADLGAGQSIGSGGSFLGNVLDGVKALGSSASEVLGSLWKGAKDMLSPFTDAVSKITDGVGASPFGKLTGDVARKAFTSVTDWVRDKAAGVFGGSGDSGSPTSDKAPVIGKGVERWRATALQALAITGSPASWVDSLLRRMTQESHGDPNAIQGELGDINNRTGNLARGLMQVIPPTFRANALPGYNSNIFDPLSNIIASIRYATGRYGAAPRGWDRAGGYALGGLVGENPGQLGRPLLFDEGGRLPVGLSVVQNRTGAPEAVFNGSAERALLQGQSSQRAEQLLGMLVDLASEGNDVADAGFTALTSALDAQPRRTQALIRQGVR